MGAHDLDGPLGEIACVQFKVGVLVPGENRKRRVPCACSYFEQSHGSSILLCDLVQNGEFLLQPFPVLEKVGSIVLVEEIPPFRRVRVEAI